MLELYNFKLQLRKKHINTKIKSQVTFMVSFIQFEFEI